MKRYKVIDLQHTGFINDSHDNPMTAQEIRNRFWGLEEEHHTEKWSQFTLDYIAELWDVDFEVVK